MNLKAISRNVGLALLVSAFFMLLSLVVSVIYGNDGGFLPLLVSLVITFIAGAFPFIFVTAPQPIGLKDGFVTIVLSWLLSFVFGMMPYVMWGGEISLVDAWFESVSGFTTTGATILKDIEAMPHSLLFWRSSTHFIGGLGVVVFLLLIVPSASPFRKRLSRMEFSSMSREGFQIQTRKLVKVIAGVYIGIFVLSSLSLFLCGMSLFDAVNHGFSICATGGFSTKNASIAAFDSPLINVVTLVFLVIATTNFLLLFTCLSTRSLRPVLRSGVMRFYILSILSISLIVVFSLKLQGESMSWGRAFMEGFCTTVSYITTTGFCFADNSGWPYFASVLLMYASIQCGCAGSTSSGIKVDRMIVMFRSIGRQIKNHLHPGNVRGIRLNGSYMSDEQVMPMILYVVLYFVILFLATGFLLIAGVGGIEAVSGSVACLGNVGPGLGAISLAGNYDAMPVAAKLIYSLEMFLGRIEIYPVLIAVYLIFNRDK